MALFDHPDYDMHEQVSFHHDQESGLKAIIALHNTNLGPGLGGCRMYPYHTSAEALTDVLRLSKGMSYKAAMANLPQGGGKAVIIGDPRKDKSAKLMQAMGKFVNDFNGQYIIAEDSGISVEDVHQMSSQTAFAKGNQARYSVDGLKPDGNPAPATAYGVFCGIKAAVHQCFGDSIQGKKIAIQGVGHVGLRLAKHLYEAGAKLFVSDIYNENLLHAQTHFDATIVDNKKIHALDVDVFSPCALGGAINHWTVKEIRAKIIAGAANNQLATNDLDVELRTRQIQYVPDYVINAGGIIDIYHQSLAASSSELMLNQIAQIGDTVLRVLEKANREKRGTQDVANQIAYTRFSKTAKLTEQAKQQY